MIYHLWAKEFIVEKLIKAGYEELLSPSIDKEVICVDTSRKVFEVTYKHLSQQAPYSDDINFILQEEISSL